MAHIQWEGGEATPIDLKNCVYDVRTLWYLEREDWDRDEDTVVDALSTKVAIPGEPDVAVSPTTEPTAMPSEPEPYSAFLDVPE